MARKKQSPAEDVMELVAMLPWWVGVVLALVFYVILHRLAVPPKVVAVQPGQVAGLAQSFIVSGLAGVGQFIIPLLCLLGALGSFVNRRKRAALVSVVANSSGPEGLNGISWPEFELLVGEAFRIQGYTVTERGGAQADGGVDLVLRKGTETFLVQCKQWKAYKVGVDVVRELYGVMSSRGAVGGFVVTSGSFTADAQAFVKGLSINLVDGPKLFGLLQRAKASLNGTATSAAGATPIRPARTGEAAAAAPLCPVCNGSMVRRTAKKGANAGSQFWGCSKYPACRGTR
jgi:restriction system protein